MHLHVGTAKHGNGPANLYIIVMVATPAVNNPKLKFNNGMGQIDPYSKCRSLKLAENT